MGVKLVALDIDGTIVHSHEDVPAPRITQAVARLRNAGVVVVLASGRMFPGTARVARHLEITEPVICQQGCSVHLMTGEMIPTPVGTTPEFSGSGRYSGRIPDTRPYSFVAADSPLTM